MNLAAYSQAGCLVYAHSYHCMGYGRGYSYNSNAILFSFYRAENDLEVSTEKYEISSCHILC